MPGSCIPRKRILPSTYRKLSEDEIAGLYAQMDSLTDAARAALDAEIERRGVKGAHLLKMYAAEGRHDTSSRSLGKLRRKKLAFSRFSGMGLKDWLIVLLLAGGLILISRLISGRH